MNQNNDYKYGQLPARGALAAAYIPMQNSVKPSYSADEALSQGTLFPGLDLPFMNMVNRKLNNTPLSELMAIDFVTDELELYLDTHKNDSEAFSMLKTFLALREEAYSRYTRLYGPVQQKDLQTLGEYSWLCDPWPWDYKPEGEE